ncbi:MAG: hypothetical protein HS127_15880 [Planctomycetia bacterium]|nr:hypothetical protein [Planctomycetia bacterium]
MSDGSVNQAGGEIALICLGMPAENSWIRSLTSESKILSDAPEDFRWKSIYAAV